MALGECAATSVRLKKLDCSFPFLQNSLTGSSPPRPLRHHNTTASASRNVCVMAPELTTESQTDNCDNPALVNKSSDEVEAKPFRLLDLPPELWLKIGQMTIDALAPVENKDIITWSRSWHTGKKPNQKPTLALTCRQLHAELMPYFYNTKTNFILELNSYFEVHLGKWLNCIGMENRKHLKGMRALVYRSKGGSVEKKERELGEFWKLKVDLLPMWTWYEEKTGRWTGVLKVTMVE